MANTKFNIFPNLPAPLLHQIYIFLFLYFVAGLALVYGWLGAAFHMTNGTILLVCFFTILHNENAKIYFLHAYALIISAVLDVLTIAFNWNLNLKFWQFYFAFALAILMIAAKIILFLDQLQIAKALNGEPPLPVDLSKMFKASNPQTNDLEVGTENQEQKQHSVYTIHKHDVRQVPQPSQSNNVDTL